MARLLTAGALIGLILSMGCTDKEDRPFGAGDGGSGGDGGDDTGPSDGGGGDGGDTGGDGGSDGGSVDDERFDLPGDVVRFADKGGTAEVDLSDLSGDSNIDQEFFLLLVHTVTGPLGYQLRYDALGGPGAPGADPGAAERVQPGHRRATSAFRGALREAIQTGGLAPASPPPPLTSYDESDIGTAVRDFRVRSSMVDEAQYEASSATLWAIGEEVAIWVDDQVAIDWDVDCDGEVDIPDEFEAYGFDNCDLQTIADIVDYNIVPNTRGVFGTESDVNGDGLISVLITPELNVISNTSVDEDVQGRLVGSYADPEVDLNEWNSETNPLSNEQEVIYVFAPDPYGFYNPEALADVDEYTSMELSALIARSYFSLISYNQHVLVAGGAPEEDWLNLGFGALAADLTGFGATYHDDAWDYLDATHLQPLVTSSDSGALTTDSVGAQYLFARWLYDQAGKEADGLMANLVQVGADGDTGADASGTTGTENVAAVTGETFEDLVIRWQVALLSSGVLGEDGEPLVDPVLYPPIRAASTLTAPIFDPASGDRYGANGYQQGVNLRGVNRFMEGGTTAGPVENVGRRVTMNGPDFATYVTGNDFWGHIEGEYAVQVVRLTEITFDSARLKIQAGTSGYTGAVVRWQDRDPLRPDIAVERIFSPTAVDDVALPPLSSEGGTIYGIGGLSAPGSTTIVDGEEGSEEKEVVDTDRWLLSLEDFPLGQDVRVAVQLSRQYANETGDAAPFDPWLAVVPASWVPTPTVEGTQRGSCAQGEDFQYPTSMLGYLYHQLFLSGDDGSASFDPTGFDCGPIQDETSCGEDWDRDGILDIDELNPDSFLAQMNAMQCTLNGNDEALFELVLAEQIIDVDTLDEDEESYFHRGLDLGGRADASGEEAFLEILLEGGEEYVIVVGGASFEGTYELEIRQVD